MNNTSNIRTAFANSVLDSAPALIRNTLFDDPVFMEEYEITTDAVLSFNNLDLSIQRSSLFSGIRKILSSSSKVTVKDTDGREWNIKNDAENGCSPILVISAGDKQTTLSDFSVLSSETSIRLSSFDHATSNVNLTGSAYDYWSNLLEERALTDDELNRYRSDLDDTPIRIANAIHKKFKTGQIAISTLIPHSRRYYNRLVGVYNGSTSIADYAVKEGRQLLSQLTKWLPYEGLLYSLFLSSHSTLVVEIEVKHLSDEELIRAFKFLCKHGDRISQLGAIEIGLRIMSERPGIEPHILHLVEQIRDDDIDASVSGLKLFSALFVLVDGELSRTRLMANEPPFYRRLASLSQSALIHRIVVNSGIKIDDFCEWAFNIRRMQFYMQSLTDMRQEPRWDPTLASASQLKAGLLGRIVNAAKKHEQYIKDSSLHRLILGIESDSILSLCEFPWSYFPEPLEGVFQSPNILSDEFLEGIRAQLSAEEVGSSSFIALVNSALIFQIDSDEAEYAARTLKLSNYRLANLEDRTQLLTILNGLATVAAASRSSKLADELRMLVRRYRRDSQYALSIDEVIRICLVSAASRTDLNDWMDFSGDWLTELAFGDLGGDDGEVLHSNLRYLFHAVPELWISCGKADAALVAYNSRQRRI